MSGKHGLLCDMWCLKEGSLVGCLVVRPDFLAENGKGLAESLGLIVAHGRPLIVVVGSVLAARSQVIQVLLVILQRVVGSNQVFAMAGNLLGQPRDVLVQLLHGAIIRTELLVQACLGGLAVLVCLGPLV